jgi:glycosyltransferase involved in cell wall biosynthesis
MSEHCIVIPLYNDWQSAVILLEKINTVVAAWDRGVSVLFVNDGSTDPRPDLSDVAAACAGITDIRVIDLVCNQGHQRAIAVGLCHAHVQGGFESVFVMDVDGEDPPGELNDLFSAHDRKGGAIITANRVSRSEGPVFQLWYWCYKLLFGLLTGTEIRFGNFSLIPGSLMARLVVCPDLWNSYSGCLKKSKLPLVGVPSHRGKRLVGDSKMNFVALVLHGLSAISVFKDVMLVRLTVAAALLVGVGGGVLAGAFLAWLSGGADTALLLACGVGFGFTALGAVVVVLNLFSHLNDRAVQQDGPLAFWKKYVQDIHTVKP